MALCRGSNRRILVVLLIMIATCCLISYLMSPPHLVTVWDQLFVRYNPLSENSKGKESITLLAAVNSAPDHLEMRKAIRESWGHYIIPESRDKLLFFMGMSEAPDINLSVKKEAEKYKDIIQGNFIDSFKNQSLRSVYLLKYSYENYNVQFLLKVEEYAFINVPLLIGVLRRLKDTKKFILGSLSEKTKPERDIGSLWYVSESEYPKEYFPIYVQNYAYVISGTLIPLLLKATATTNRLWIDDVYTTGVLAENVNALHINSDLFTSVIPSNECDNGKFVAVADFSSSTLIKFYTSIEMPNEKCNV